MYERVFLFFFLPFFFIALSQRLLPCVLNPLLESFFFLPSPPNFVQPFQHAYNCNRFRICIQLLCSLTRTFYITYHTSKIPTILYTIYACNSSCISSCTIYVRMRIYSLTFFIAWQRGGNKEEEEEEEEAGSCGSAELALLFFHQIFFIHQVFNLQKCSFIRTNNLYSVWICHVLLFPIVATLFWVLIPLRCCCCYPCYNIRFSFVCRVRLPCCFYCICELAHMESRIYFLFHIFIGFTQIFLNTILYLSFIISYFI